MNKPYLCIDFYKTLSFKHLWHTAPTELNEKIEQLLFSDSASSMMIENWMRGKVSSEDVNRYVAQSLNINLSILWDYFVHSASTLDISLDAIELINQLRQRYTTVLVTDNMDSFNRFTVPALKLDSTFDSIVNSAVVGSLKSDQDGKIFTHITNNFSGSILIDDVEVNCKLFEQLGGTAYQVTSAATVTTYLQQLI